MVAHRITEITFIAPGPLIYFKFLRFQLWILRAVYALRFMMSTLFLLNVAIISLLTYICLRPMEV